MRKAMKDLESVTGYNGDGFWEKKQNTVVDYTDTQGTRRRKEVEIYFVHASSDPKSPVVYEVIKDPATGEMMFTLRKAKDNTENIKGLDEQQAATIRQAWAYLLAADPEVMQKFWRVNSAAGVSTGDFPQLSTNDISRHLIKFNPERLKEFSTFPTIVGVLIVEAEELYAAQFGYTGHNWQYINIPPNCLDKNAMADSWKRALQWLNVYGKNLPRGHGEILRDMISGSLSGVQQIPCPTPTPKPTPSP